MKVELFFWEIPKTKIFHALLKISWQFVSLKLNRNISFFKLLGTGKGETFTPNDANLSRWGLLIISERSQELNAIQSWQKIANSEKHYLLSPISAHGKWSRKNPFDINILQSSESKIAVITRAKIKYRHLFKFWANVPPVVSSLKSSPGLIEAFGIGESPIGLQGTFSLWKNESSIKDFAFKGEAHALAIRNTQKIGWYSEELFARFEVISTAE
jgi:hypothetical protein